ncbi:family 16 glycosylhydrolase [Algisphaera agarilytica]|uniref:GH16 domain-containing protein n=1 Tax=Algisphaera agarilytica TaxID=1385975 RepID=A0A7X0H4J3_9BACT|nr:family 16 glycosylhydrolase [Algisphaera agarilytica]MBB6429146.1 hypothetical protein [Algisphaera agarilytica]
MTVFLVGFSVLAQADVTHPLPYSDPANEGAWIYNERVSDEFDGDTIDEDRWFIVGKFEDGRPQYIHPDNPNKKVWKGRAPSQFSGRNYRLEDGKLILETRWEPDFPFSEDVPKPHFGPSVPYENITTACFIGRREFKYGYVEIKSKAAPAEVASGFWSMGDGLEFDFYELVGHSNDPEKNDYLDSLLWWSIRDWKVKPYGKPTYTEKRDVGFNVADDFHIWGVEWSEDGIKYFIDGKLFSDVSAEDAHRWALENRSMPQVPEDYDGYVATVPIHLWIDNEIFPWVGIPTSKEELEAGSPPELRGDGVVDYEIEYVRVWQTHEQMKQSAITANP